MAKTAQWDELSQADVGDLAKVMAVATVMTQSVITILMGTAVGPGQQFFLGGFYEVIKFSAPAFIFGILYSTIRTHPGAGLRDYPAYLRNRWHVLFIPSILWTTVYLLLVPQLQQHRHYHTWQGFCWQFINGNAAPHLWYNVMMLQFIIIMPFFWWLARKLGHHPRGGLAVFALALVFEIAWYRGYEVRVFHRAAVGSRYLLDRVFPSFLVFAVSGTLLWVFYHQLAPFLWRHWRAQLLAWLVFAAVVCTDFFHYGYPVRLANAPYYLPSMLFYDLTTIGLIATLLLYLQQRRSQWLPLVHWVALYAHRAYLGHVFWLYWSWRLLHYLAPHLPVLLAFPILVAATIILAFGFAYGAHRVWSRVRGKDN